MSSQYSVGHCSEIVGLGVRVRVSDHVVRNYDNIQGLTHTNITLRESRRGLLVDSWHRVPTLSTPCDGRGASLAADAFQLKRRGGLEGRGVYTEIYTPWCEVASGRGSDPRTVDWIPQAMIRPSRRFPVIGAARLGMQDIVFFEWTACHVACRFCFVLLMQNTKNRPGMPGTPFAGYKYKRKGVLHAASPPAL